MAKKKTKKKEAAKSIGFTEYDELLEKHPLVKDAMPANVLEHMKKTDKATRKHLKKLWEENVKWNINKNVPKHGWINDGFIGMAKAQYNGKDLVKPGKAVVAIGSGPSLNKNKEFLHDMLIADGILPFNEQMFISMAPNHEIKPCLNSGIYPHFAMVGDASPHLKDQLDVGEDGKSTILIAGLNVHPDVIDVWPGPVRFMMQRNEIVRGIVEKETGKAPDINRCIVEGGNILNASYMLSLALFHAPAWICVGNDLSYPMEKDIKKRRVGHYADGDYEANIKSKRDESKHELTWAAFEFVSEQMKEIAGDGKDRINLNLVYTAPQLFVYKVWLEINAPISWDLGAKMLVYNCSEGGILGVQMKADAQGGKEKFDKRENWQLVDELTPRWRTRRLINAYQEFITATMLLKKGESALSIGRWAKDAKKIIKSD